LAENVNQSQSAALVSGYEGDWREYKRIRNTFLLVFVTHVPVCFTVAVISGKLLGTFAPAFIVAGLWLILALFSGVRLSIWRCPRCGRMVPGNVVVQPGFSGAAQRTLRLA
jgi:hypothetical protein